LLIYNWLITLDEEIEFFWRKRFTGASWLYFLIRYIGVFCDGILQFVGFARLSDKVRSFCALLSRASFALQMLQYIPWAAFAALRVFALSGMRYTPAIIVFLLSLGAPIVNYMQFAYNVTGFNVPGADCLSTVSIPPETSLMCVLARTTLIMADIIVISVTVMSSRRSGAVARLGTAARLSLGQVLLHDGTEHTPSVITCFNIIDLVLSVLSVRIRFRRISAVGHRRVLTQTHSVTEILLTRFLLDLQAADQASRRLDFTGSLNFLGSTTNAETSLRFAHASRAIGSLGASLGPASFSMLGEEDDPNAPRRGDGAAGCDDSGCPTQERLSDCGDERPSSQPRGMIG
ncbi:hypothetical protein BD413DRAFT_482144, partial [Trametes elegans]